MGAYRLRQPRLCSLNRKGAQDATQLTLLRLFAVDELRGSGAGTRPLDTLVIVIALCAFVIDKACSALSVAELRFILVAEITHGAQHRIRRRLAQSAETGRLHHLAELFQKGQLGARGRGLRRDGAAADAEDQLMRETQSTSVPGAVTCRSSPSSARTLS